MSAGCSDDEGRADAGSLGCDDFVPTHEPTRVAELDAAEMALRASVLTRELSLAQLRRSTAALSLLTVPTPPRAPSQPTLPGSTMSYQLG